MEKLPGDYIAGFVDGEGCFALKFIRSVRHERPGSPVYFYWAVEFAILIREDDRGILEKIQATLQCGKISHSKRGADRYAVNSFADLSNKIIPFFDLYPLRAKKVFDFILWKEALEILNRNHQLRNSGARGFSKTSLTEMESKRLIEIHNSMKAYKSKQKEWKWIDNAVL